MAAAATAAVAATASLQRQLRQAATAAPRRLSPLPASPQFFPPKRRTSSADAMLAFGDCGSTIELSVPPQSRIAAFLSFNWLEAYGRIIGAFPAGKSLPPYVLGAARRKLLRLWKGGCAHCTPMNRPGTPLPFICTLCARTIARNAHLAPSHDLSFPFRALPTCACRPSPLYHTCVRGCLPGPSTLTLTWRCRWPR